MRFAMLRAATASANARFLCCTPDQPPLCKRAAGSLMGNCCWRPATRDSGVAGRPCCCTTGGQQSQPGTPARPDRRVGWKGRVRGYHPTCWDGQQRRMHKGTGAWDERERACQGRGGLQRRSFRKSVTRCGEFHTWVHNFAKSRAHGHFPEGD